MAAQYFHLQNGLPGYLKTFPHSSAQSAGNAYSFGVGSPEISNGRSSSERFPAFVGETLKTGGTSYLAKLQYLKRRHRVSIEENRGGGVTSSVVMHEAMLYAMCIDARDIGCRVLKRPRTAHSDCGSGTICYWQA